MVRPERAERAGQVHHDRVGRQLEQRECGLGHSDDADGVGVKHLQCLRAVARDQSDTGVVDKHVESAVRSYVGEGGSHRRSSVTSSWTKRPPSSSAAARPPAWSRAPIHTVCPPAMSWRAVSLPRPLFAPVINVVVIVQGCALSPRAGSGPVVIGLPGPPPAAARLAYWSCGIVGVRPHRTPLARPTRPRDGRRPHREPPARHRPAPGGARRVGQHLGRLPDPARTRAGDVALRPGARIAGPRPTPARRRKRISLPTRRPGPPRPRRGFLTRRAQPAALTRPYGQHTGRGLRRGLVPDRGQRPLQRPHGRHHGLARPGTQQRLAPTDRPGHPRRPHARRSTRTCKPPWWPTCA